MTTTDNRQAPTRNWVPFGVAAALLLVSLFSVFVLRLLDTLADREALLTVLASKQVEITILEGNRDTAAYGKVLRNWETGRVVLHVSRLQAAPSGKEYHLWLIRQDTSISVGAFTVKEPGDNFFQFAFLSTGEPHLQEAFIVTLESREGALQPSGEVYLKASR